jgi:hypothetical protein
MPSTAARIKVMTDYIRDYAPARRDLNRVRDYCGASVAAIVYDYALFMDNYPYTAKIDKYFSNKDVRQLTDNYTNYVCKTLGIFQ